MSEFFAKTPEKSQNSSKELLYTKYSTNKSPDRIITLRTPKKHLAIIQNSDNILMFILGYIVTKSQYSQKRIIN